MEHYGYFNSCKDILFYGKHHDINVGYLTFSTWAEYHRIDREFNKIDRKTCVRVAVLLKRKIVAWVDDEPDHNILVDYYFARSKILGIPVRTTTPEQLSHLAGMKFNKLKNDFRKVCGIQGDHIQGGNCTKSKRRRRRKKTKKHKVAKDTLTKDQITRGIEQRWSTLEAAMNVQKENGVYRLVV